MGIEAFPRALQKVMVRQFLSSGEVLFQQGDSAKYLYWVRSGQMRLISFVNQQMITHYFVEAGELLGETALYLSTYHCTAEASTRTEIMAIPVEAFRDGLKTNPLLLDRYLASLTHRLCQVCTLIELRSLNSGRDRLLYYLMHQLMPGQNSVTLTNPLRAIANELAITPESLSRWLSRLQAEGVITREKRSITFSQEWLNLDSSQVLFRTNYTSDA